jgi:tetratricopeptide (TPR) repeat protein
MITLFIVFRCKNYVLGDSFRLMPLLGEPMSFSPTEHLTLLLLRQLYDLIGDAEVTYLVVSVTSGVLFLIIVVLFAKHVARNRTDQIAAVAVFLGLAQIQLFFGYVENYSLVTALITIFIFLGLLSLENRRYFWWAVIVFTLAGAFHLLAGFLLPGLICLFWLRGREERQPRYILIASIVTIIAVAASIILTMQFEEESIFNPIIASSGNPYSLFSTQHLTDVMNILLLVAPLPALMIISLLRSRRLAISNQTLFLLMCTAGGACLLFFVDPKLGAIRDWDLLSLYGIPLAFLATTIFFRAETKLGKSDSYLKSALAVILLHTVPWVYANSSSTCSYKHLKQVVVSDIHYSPQYYEGERLMSWGVLAADSYGDIQEVYRSFKLRIQADSSDRRAWLYYARACTDLGKLDDAVAALNRVGGASGLNEGQVKTLIGLCIHTKEISLARQVLESAAADYPEDPEFLFYAGLVNYFEHKYKIAAKIFERAMTYSSQNAELIIWYARTAVILNDLALAERQLELARDLPQLNETNLKALLELQQTIDTHVRDSSAAMDRMH